MIEYIKYLKDWTRNYLRLHSTFIMKLGWSGYVTRHPLSDQELIGPVYFFKYLKQHEEFITAARDLKTALKSGKSNTYAYSYKVPFHVKEITKA